MPFSSLINWTYKGEVTIWKIHFYSVTPKVNTVFQIIRKFFFVSGAHFSAFLRISDLLRLIFRWFLVTLEGLMAFKASMYHLSPGPYVNKDSYPYLDNILASITMECTTDKQNPVNCFRNVNACVYSSWRNLQQVKYRHVEKLKQFLKSCFSIEKSQTELCILFFFLINF